MCPVFCARSISKSKEHPHDLISGRIPNLTVVSIHGINNVHFFLITLKDESRLL